MTNGNRCILLAVLLILPARTVLAEGGRGRLGFGEAGFKQEMETDRPDFTEGTQTVESGHLQVESGYTYYFNDDSGVRTESHTAPEILSRIGVKDDLELRVSWLGHVWEEQGASGAAGPALGYKQRILDEGFKLSYIFEMGLPAGSDEQRSQGVEPGVKLLLADDLSENFALAGNINLASKNEDDDRFLESSASVSGGYSVSQNFGVYLEYFGIYPEGSGREAENYLNGGGTYLLTENIQLDLRVGAGLNSEASDLFSGVGLSFRI